MVNHRISGLPGLSNALAESLALCVACRWHISSLTPTEGQRRASHGQKHNCEQRHKQGCGRAAERRKWGCEPHVPDYEWGGSSGRAAAAAARQQQPTFAAAPEATDWLNWLHEIFRVRRSRLRCPLPASMSGHWSPAFQCTSCALPGENNGWSSLKGSKEALFGCKPRGHASGTARRFTSALPRARQALVSCLQQ